MVSKQSELDNDYNYNELKYDAYFGLMIDWCLINPI